MTHRPHAAVPSRAATSNALLDGEPLTWLDTVPVERSLVIVGGGFSGLMTAIHALRAAPAATAMIVERLPRERPGAAYGGADHAHLLNVRADRMGLTTSDVGGFASWLQAHHPGQYQPSDFVRRQLFGDYLNEWTREAMAPLRSRLAFVQDEVRHVERTADGMTVRLASGAVTRTAAVVLALGLPAPGVPWAGATPAGSVADPWSPSAYDGLDPEAPVVVLGTGLTALDVLGSLSRRGHCGAITFVSRHGRFPLPHSAPSTGAPVTLAAEEIIAGPRRALRELRRTARAAVAAARPWQDAVDAVRPHTTAAWRTWSDADRARFLRRVRPMWEVHRHRAPAAPLALVERGLASGRMHVLRGTILGIEGAAPRWTVTLRGDGRATHTRDAARVFNCIGPAMRLAESGDPLLGTLLSQALVSTDAAALGLRADAHGRALDASGRGHDDLFVLGALRRGDLWESTAVPELRVQAEAVGAAVAAAVSARRA